MVQEWNLFTVTNALFLFGLGGGVSWEELSALPLPLKLFLIAVELVVPLLGNLRSKYVSFLPAMRYYAGELRCACGTLWIRRPPPACPCSTT